MIKMPRTIIGVPGCWANRSDIVASIATRSGGYLFAGDYMMKIGTDTAYKLEIYEHDPNLANAFSIAGRGRLRDVDLEAIRSHTFTLYLVVESGTIPAAQALLHVTRALILSGGIGVKVESAGTAHRVDQWEEFCADDRLDHLLWAYVVYVGDRGHYYSCGMHNFGYKDAIVEVDIPPDDAAKIIHAFLRYLLIENPIINDGETFSISEKAPRYRIFRESCTRFEVDNPFHNPFGIMRIVPA